MKLSSPEFENGEHMPEKVGYTKQNVNPELRIEDVPRNAKSLVVLMDDPDAREPAGKVWDHWTVWNINPGKRKIEEGESPGTEGMTDFGERGYGGPNPPDQTHTYRFRVYALDKKLEPGREAMKGDIIEEMEGHIIEEAKLEGKYDPV